MSDVEIIISGLSSWMESQLDAILITGSGESFCSGLFLDDFDHKTWKKNPITLICEQIENCNCPVICALNGGAYGGAVEIALACDFRIANNNLLLSVPASRLGIQYEPSGLRRALNMLGPTITRRLFILGEVILLEDILRTYFVDFLVEDDENLIEKCNQVIDYIKNGAPLAIAGMKKTIIGLLNNSLDGEMTEKQIKLCFESEDHKEALLARREKRRPKFRGI